MLIGSARVSKADGSQSLDLQRDALRAAGVDAGHVYHDFASGVRDDRPGLDSCVRALRTGDVLVVWKLDRLGRNLAHLVNTVQDLSARGVGLRVLTGQGAQIDTTTAAGRLVFGIFAALAEFERELDSTTQRRCAAGCGERCSPAGARESNPSTVEGSLVGRGRDDGGWRRDRVLLAVLRSDRIARVGLRTERWPVDDDARSLRPWAAGQGWPVLDRFQYPWNDQREFHRHRLRGHIR